MKQDPHRASLVLPLSKKSLQWQAIQWWRRAFSSKIARQTGILYLSNLLVMVFGAITAPILTRMLGPEQYGDLAFITSFITFSYLFFDLGLYDSGAKLLANTEKEQHQLQLLGAFLVATLVVATVFSVFMLVAGFWVDAVFHTNVNSVLQAISVFVGVFLVRMVIEQTCKGRNRIELLFVMRVVPVVWYLVSMLILVAFSTVSVARLLMANMIGMWITTLLVVYRLRPTFTTMKQSLLEVTQDVREYGFKVFTGRALNTAARQSDRLIIGLFGSTTSVGFYSLAQMMVQPILFLPQSLAFSSFRRLTYESAVPRKMIAVIVIWVTLSSAALLLFGKTVVELLLSRAFEDVTSLMLISIIGVVFAGLTQPFNAFLGAKGYGRYLRKLALIFAIYDIVANILLIYLYGAMGAVYSSIGERALSLGLHLYYYRKSLHTPSKWEK